MVPCSARSKKEGEAGRRNQPIYPLRHCGGAGDLPSLRSRHAGKPGAVTDSPGWYFRIGAVIITLVGGTMFLMWLGEQITARGIGNGISLIIFVGIVAQLPAASRFFWTGSAAAR